MPCRRVQFLTLRGAVRRRRDLVIGHPCRVFAPDKGPAHSTVYVDVAAASTVAGSTWYVEKDIAQ